MYNVFKKLDYRKRQVNMTVVKGGFQSGAFRVDGKDVNIK